MQDVMPNPKFRCIEYIETHNNIERYWGKLCEYQCDKCINEIIDYHESKNAR